MLVHQSLSRCYQHSVQTGQWSRFAHHIAQHEEVIPALSRYEAQAPLNRILQCLMKHRMNEDN